MSQIIEHEGKIHRIDGDKVQVLITQSTACASCQAKSSCASSSGAEKIIDAISTDNSLAVGDEVIVYGQRSLGLLAVLLVFVIPFALILVSLFALRLFVENEAISGTIALAMLVPYYIILSFFKDKLKAKFQFYVRKYP
jgi:sigma-E factor negative regulatory protein RseC